MTDEREPDPAEEYFEILLYMSADDPKWQEYVMRVRDDYRSNSRYTDEYWRQREEYLKERAMKRTYEIELTDISPKMYRILTGRRVPIKAQIAYYAREWSRKLAKIAGKHTS